MKFRRVKAVIYKEFLDIVRNPLIILMILMFPALTSIFYFVVSNKPEVLNFIMPTFITMHVIMAPIICFSSVIAEEKEKNTLKVLFMSNVHQFEYLIGIGFCLIIVFLVSMIPYIFMLKITFQDLANFYFVAIAGIINSSILGAIIGVVSQNQMSVGIISSPISMILGMIPLVSNFNSNVDRFSDLLYSKRIYTLVFNYRANDLLKITKEDLSIFTINFIVLLVIFLGAYNKRKLLQYK